MIPDFDEHGNLPPGIYDATLEEVIQRFSIPKSMRRKDLCERLVRFIGFIEEFAINVYIDGSFVTNKQSPNDIDLIFVLPDLFDFNSSHARRLIGYQSMKSKNKLTSLLTFRLYKPGIFKVEFLISHLIEIKIQKA